MNKNTDNFLSPHSLVHAHTHTNKHRSHLPRMCAGTCDQVIINFSPLPRLLVSLTDATLISVCINTLRHHLHCGCEYCCSKKKKRKSRANGRKRKSQGSQKHHLWPLFFFFTCTGSITPVQKVSRNIRSKAHGFALRNFSFFFFQKVLQKQKQRNN